MKDYQTKQILMRRGNASDFYPVTMTTPQGFSSVAQSLWHQCHGHPGHQVFKHLVSNHSISYSSNKHSSLCHAYRIGKHVRLLFNMLNSITQFHIEIFHLDVCTSHVEIISGIKHYVIFWDLFSSFFCVYPLGVKSDVLSKIPSLSFFS